MVLAHGLGGRTDLPVPLWLALYAGAAAVLVSFFALAVFWVRPKLRGEASGVALPWWLERAADARATRVVLRGAGVLMLLALLAVAAYGTDDPATNPASTWFYVWFWVGLVPVSLLAGPVWRLLNPLRTVAAWLRVLPGFSDGGAWRRDLPERVGYWPAVAGLAAFLWLELVYADASSPRTIAIAVLAYAVVHVAAGAVFGPRWFDRGESFDVYFGLIASMAPVGRRDDGRLVLRNPLDGLLTIRRRTGLTAFVLVALGSTAFDGITRLRAWSDLTEGTGGVLSALLGTAGLGGAIAAVSVVYAGGVWLTRPYLRGGGGADGYADFAHALVPIMVGYIVAHYFSFAAFQGQAGVLLASDPFGLGWNLFGTAGGAIDYTVVSPSVIAWVQVAGIVIGHILGVTAAHDKATAWCAATTSEWGSTRCSR